MNRIFTRMALVGAALAACAAAHAQDFLFPLKTVTVLAPSDNGGVVDKTANLLVQGISQVTKKSVVLQSVRGEAPMVSAVLSLSKAKPDGYTVLLTSYEMSQAVKKDPEASKALAQFEPVTAIASTASLFVTGGSQPYRNLKDFMAAAREKPGQLKCATAAPPSSSAIVGADFDKKYPGLVKFVNYPHISQAVASVVSGKSDCMFELPYPLMSHLLKGQLKSMAVTSSSRMLETPRTPTFLEASGEGFVSSSWYGVHAPKGTPSMVIRRIAQGVSMALSREEILKSFGDMGYGVLSMDAEEFRRSIENDLGAARAIAFTPHSKPGASFSYAFQYPNAPKSAGLF